MVRDQSFRNSGHTEAEAQIAATWGEARGPACACARGQSGETRVQFFAEKLKASFMKVQWAARNQFCYSEQMSALTSGCGTSPEACSRDLKACAVLVMSYTLA